MQTRIVAALAAAALAGCAPVPTSQPTSGPGMELGRRYFNLAEGYSLCPPVEADRIRERLSSRTVTWTATDPATGGLVWILAATRMPTQLTAEQLGPFAERLSRKGTMLDQVAVESCRVITAAGRPAIDLRGLRTDKKQAWTRQAMILTEPGELLMLSILGPAVRRQEILSVHQAVLDSVELLDRQALAGEREANLEAGRKLLEALTAKKLATLIDPQDRWMLILRDGEVEGFVVTRDRGTESDGRPGMDTHVWMHVTQPDATVQRLEVVSFASADRSVEHWTATVRAALPARAATQRTEEVLVVRLTKQGPTIDLTETHDADPGRSTRKVLSGEMDRSYLPMVMQSVIPQVADLGTAASYAFATFAPRAHELDVHTFTVIGPEDIECGGRKVQAIHVTVRSAEDEEAQDAWLDRSGRLLRQHLSAGASLERSTREEVLRRYPAAREMLEAIDAAAASPPGATSKETR